MRSSYMSSTSSRQLLGAVLRLTGITTLPSFSSHSLLVDKGKM
jgi:hypothetical protein